MWRFIAGLAVLLVAAPASAADGAVLKILTPQYGQLALLELEPLIEARIGGRVEIEIVGTGGIPERLLKGDKIDLVVTHRESLADTAAKDTLQSQTDVAVSHVGIAVADTAPLPRLRTEAEVAAFLKNVPSLAHSTSLSGQHMAAVIEKLGLSAEMKPKIQTGGGVLGTRVVKGEVAAVAQQISELKLARLKNIAPLPASLQTDIFLTAATVRGTARTADVLKVVDLLTSREAVAAYANAGLEPAQKR